VNLVPLEPFEQGQDVAKQLLALFVLPLVEQIHPKLIEELGSFCHILSQLQIVLFIYDILRFPINNYANKNVELFDMFNLPFVIHLRAP
tara:strand:- start:251 stop:517 length:267 start_codon:yes stop_codon:yes gene_type:complete